MFENIGNKIKKLSAGICYLGIGVSCIIGIILWSSGGDELSFLLGVITALIGSLLSWLSSFMLYGYGELIDSTQKLQKTLDVIDRKNSYASTNKQWLCQKCGNLIDKSPCPICGQDTYGRKLSKIADDKSNSEQNCWFCKNCGAKNSASAQFCKQCGTYK